MMPLELAVLILALAGWWLALCGALLAGLLSWVAYTHEGRIPDRLKPMRLIWCYPFIPLLALVVLVRGRG